MNGRWSSGMKLLATAAAFGALFGWMPLSAASAAEHEGHHPPHKMIMYGENEVYASHIVYTKPHNYQVILRLHLDAAQHERYASQRRLHPKEDLIYLLDPMDISRIRSAERLTGTVFSQDENGRRTELFPLELARDEFEFVYFAEVPASLDQ